nr:TetR/AcrR family transcriptional regulator [Streptomyces sporangiiformans]
MPAARESLLDAAYTALARRPWSAVRMVDVAAEAGVSRQTLYNEFGSKEGLARALVRREADAYLAGVERALVSHAEPRERLAAAAEWTAAAARANALVRAMLTGCWGERLPSPTLSAVPSSSAVPAQRRADARPRCPPCRRHRRCRRSGGPTGRCRRPWTSCSSYGIVPWPCSSCRGPRSPSRRSLRGRASW